MYLIASLLISYEVIYAHLLIISNTLKTPQTFEQDEDEWVVVLQGCAKIVINNEVHKLQKGDSLFIPAKQKHTLLKTKKIVIWLAVYIK